MKLLLLWLRRAPLPLRGGRVVAVLVHGALPGALLGLAREGPARAQPPPVALRDLERVRGVEGLLDAPERVVGEALGDPPVDRARDVGRGRLKKLRELRIKILGFAPPVE